MTDTTTAVDVITDGGIPALARRLGVAADHREKPTGRPWKTHAEFLIADQEAVNRLNQLAGPKRRSFAEVRASLGYGECDGMMVIADHEVEEGNPTLGAVCDDCGFRIGLRREEFDPFYVVRKLLARSGLPGRYLGKKMEPMAGQREARQVLRDWLADWDRPQESEGEPLRLPVPLLYGQPGRG